MDDPSWSWPAWKFGLKRDDLFNSLHDQYNTFTFSLQDPEAFHADVCEISRDAETSEDFHRLMADRRRQRLHELHESLESLAVEIIANPKLMDSEHWTYALQLFRTKSFDSLVRYFASYLPRGYLDRDGSRGGSYASSFSDAISVHTASTKASSVDDAPAQYEYPFTDGPAMTEQPHPIDYESCFGTNVNESLSPSASDTTEDSASSNDFQSRSFASSGPPSRSMSFSGSEMESFRSGFCRSLVNDDETSQSDSCDSAVTSVSDCGESRSSLDTEVDDDEHIAFDEEDEEELVTVQFPEDSFDAFDNLNDTPETDDTPTPRQEALTTCYVEYKTYLTRRLPSPHRRRSPSPRSHRAGTPPRDARRSPEEVHSKIQKTSQDTIRRRPKGRI